jgi:membrane protease YdiL (CAAX protease family)
MTSRRRELLLETSAVVAFTLGPSLIGAVDGRELDVASFLATDFYSRAFEQLGWVLLIVFLLGRDAGFEWRLPESLRDWGKEIAAGLFLLAATWYFSSRIGDVAGALGAESHASFWAEVGKSPTLAFAARVTMPLSALAEEMLFRVYLQTRLSELLGGRPFVVILVSAGLFSAVHGYAPRAAWGVFATGAILGASYLMNRRIPRLVLAHVVTNILIPLR